MLLGPPGFARVRHAGELEIDLRSGALRSQAAALRPQDPLWRNLEGDPRLGLLFIDLATRQRLRVNGRARRVADDILQVTVEEAYPNCPKYIQRRHPSARDLPNDHETPARDRRGRILLPAHRAWIEGADTLFVASAHSEHGADASHRGGNPGFVRLVDEKTLRIPDYAGNNMFNTLGNFVANPRAGILFVDFDQHRLLQLSGRAEIVRQTSEPAAGDRSWQFETEQWIESELPPLYAWSRPEYSRFNPGSDSP